MSPVDKHDRFVSLAEARTNKILDMIDRLGNCSNKNNYSYTEDEVNRIFNAIETQLKIAKERFTGKENKHEKFTLS